jgi:hypothetical protein
MQNKYFVIVYLILTGVVKEKIKPVVLCEKNICYYVYKYY